MEIKAKPRPNSQSITCPHCGDQVSPKAKTCPHCSGPLFHDGEAIETPVCPRCRVELKKVKTEGEDELETCENCGGYWLDYQNFSRATNPQRLSKEFADSKNHWHKPEVGPIQYVSCPRCGRYMNRENFSKISGIVIDRCGDPLTMVSIVAISLRWWVAWFGTCWRSTQKGRRNGLPSVFR